MPLGIYKIKKNRLHRIPLHWAAIRGNLEACIVLVQARTLDDLMWLPTTLPVHQLSFLLIKATGMWLCFCPMQGGFCRTEG
ncbi:hypothetical protein GOP47_0029342 [Adiantum capillus-veneris]|nr:hypothetical protein GOP47_0029342 [Adiantum capillus-veneris]